MFRRKKDAGEDEPTADGAPPDKPENTPPLKPFSRRGAHVPKHPPAASFRAEIPRRPVDVPGGRRERAPAATTEGKKLIVGREISLQGEITACEKLVVEGRVEATLTQGQSIEIAETGLFKGTVEIDEAVISGRFEGDLTVRKRLVIHTGGKVIGKVRYGTIEIEAGGQVSGEIDVLGEPGRATAGSATEEPAAEQLAPASAASENI